MTTSSSEKQGELDVVVRPGLEADLAPVLEVQQAARDASGEAMPPPTGPEDWRLDRDELWVAQDATGAVVGFVVLQGDFVHSVYVAPPAQRRGVGSLLLDLVKAMRPGGFSLYVYATNSPAQAFYAAHGLIGLEPLEASAAHPAHPRERRLAWTGADPLGFLRDQIDLVDAELGDLLARRVALTSAVQAAKAAEGAPAGPEGRDPAREREIAEAVALRVPALGVERVGRIMDAVITESLEVRASEQPPR